MLHKNRKGATIKISTKNLTSSFLAALFLVGCAASFCYGNGRIIDPSLFKSYFENSSVALNYFYRMQDDFLSRNHWFLFDVSTIHTISTDFKIPVDVSKPLFEAPYETGGVEHHHFILLLKSSNFGGYLIADATSLVPTKEGKVKYDEIEFWTYGEGIIGIFLGNELSKFHLGIFQKISPRSFNNNFTYDPSEIDNDGSPFFNTAASISDDYAFFNYTQANSWNITSILGLKKFSLYSLNLRYPIKIQKYLMRFFPNIDYFAKHKNIKPGNIWYGPPIGNFIMLNGGIKFKNGTNLENLATGFTFYIGVNKNNKIWKEIPEDDFYFTISFSGSYSNYIGTLLGYNTKIDFANVPYIKFLSIGYSHNYYYDLLRVPFENNYQMTLDWTLKL